MGSYAADISGQLPTFQNSLSGPTSKVKQMVPRGCSETKVTNYWATLRNIPEEQLSERAILFSLLRSGT